MVGVAVPRRAARAGLLAQGAVVVEPQGPDAEQRRGDARDARREHRGPDQRVLEPEHLAGPQARVGAGAAEQVGQAAAQHLRRARGHHAGQDDEPVGRERLDRVGRDLVGDLELGGDGGVVRERAGVGRGDVQQPHRAVVLREGHVPVPPLPVVAVPGRGDVVELAGGRGGGEVAVHAGTSHVIRSTTWVKQYPSPSTQPERYAPTAPSSSIRSRDTESSKTQRCRKPSTTARSVCPTS